MDKKENAKRVKIETLYKGNLRKVGIQKLSGLCPFHEDHDPKNPNFIIYLATNTWYCFAGCGGGDSISYIMKEKNCDFKEALKILT